LNYFLSPGARSRFASVRPTAELDDGEGLAHFRDRALDRFPGSEPVPFGAFPVHRLAHRTFSAARLTGGRARARKAGSGLDGKDAPAGKAVRPQANAAIRVTLLSVV